MIRNTDASFYSSGRGDYLIDSSKYPEEIVQYLAGEENLLMSMRNQFDTLIEIGCMNGRYLDWAITQEKNYFGIDVVERYVKNGQEKILLYGLPSDRYCIEVCDATLVHKFLHNKSWLQNKDRIISILPFNSFGNMNNPNMVLNSLSETRHPFLICSYLITDFANQSRMRYYANCGYQQIRCISNETGIRFVSYDGLDTIAYNAKYLEQLFVKNGISFEIILFSSIGVAYKGLAYYT